MIRKIVGAVLGAAVVFAWTSFSYMGLDWHSWEMKAFKDDGKVVVEALKNEATETGFYTLPNFSKDLVSKDLQPDDIQKSEEKRKEWIGNAHKGPFVFMSVKNEGMQWDMTRALINQAVLILVVALIATFLLATTAIQNFLGRALLVCIGVTSGAILSDVSMWNWWGFPMLTTCVNIADIAIGWFLAGLVMSKIVK